jgi:dihydroorotate dehydrogenase
MDKRGVGVRAWSALGFSHAELGTVTARPQPGNKRPRLFRLPASQAIVNRMGFNNDGAESLARRLDAAGVRRGNGALGLAVGVSIGKTKTTPLSEATADYLNSLRLLAPYADYVAVNVSSPNTPGLRSLQDRAALAELVEALVAESRVTSTTSPPVPVFVKIAPDLDDAGLDEVVEVCESAGAGGLIATNTTLSREGVARADAELGRETGGLSGAPLAARAREVVRYLTDRSRLPVIGVGGILSAADGQAMLDAGAALVQVYTGFVYRGPALVAELNRLSPASSKSR